MPAAQSLRVVAPGGAPDLPGGAAKELPHLVLVTSPAGAPAALAPGAPCEPGAPADVRRQRFGPRLRAARERSGITLHQIAETTKVSPSLLAALERNDVSRWPKGIYRRSFFRDYVVALGLPPEPLMAEFLQLFPDGEDHAAAAIANTEAPSLRLTLAPAMGLPRGRLRAAAIELMLVTLLAVAIVWWLDAGVLIGAGVFALCYYHRLITALRGWRMRPRLPRSGGDWQRPWHLLTSR